MRKKNKVKIVFVGIIVVLFSIGSSVVFFRTTETSSYWKDSTSWIMKPNYEKSSLIIKTPYVEGFGDRDVKTYNNNLYQLVSYPIKQFNIDSISFVHKNDTNEAIALIYYSYKKKNNTVNFSLEVSSQFEAIQMPKFLNSTSFVSSVYRYFSKQLYLGNKFY